MRIAALMNVIGREGMDLFDTFQWQANEDEGKFEDVGPYCVNSLLAKEQLDLETCINTLI